MANICPICNNELRQYGDSFYVCDVCETYFDKNENIVLTEQEWLQTATTEQLAEWIAKIVDCDCCPIKRKFCDDNPCKIRFAKWLKQPHIDKE